MKYCAKCKEPSWGMIKLGDYIKLDNSIFDIKELCGKCWYILINAVQELVRDIVGDQSTLCSDITIVEKKAAERSDFEKRCDKVQKDWPLSLYLETFIDTEHFYPCMDDLISNAYCTKCHSNSAKINCKKNCWICLHCNSGGDIISYVAFEKNISTADTVDYLEGLSADRINFINKVKSSI